MVFAPGIAPILANSAAYIMIVVVGHAVMRLVAGPARTGWLTEGDRNEITNPGVTSCECSFRADDFGSGGAVVDTTRDACFRIPGATMAKRHRHLDTRRFVSLAIEAFEESVGDSHYR